MPVSMVTVIVSHWQSSPGAAVANIAQSRRWAAGQLSVQHLADRGKQGLRNEGLLQQVDPSLQNPVLRDRVARIARHEQHLEANPMVAQLFAKLATVHTG
jgi:hypothetical protein